MSPRLIVLLSCASGVALPGIAHAELGGALASVEADRGRMGAQMVSVAHRNFRQHELTRANGGMVRELTNANGAVFAVIWSGPGKPDLRGILGRYFDAYQTAGADIGRSLHALRRPPQVSAPDLQIQTSGHMGFFRGIAYVPSLAPAGFAPADLPVAP